MTRIKASAANPVNVRVGMNVLTAFNAATTNVLTAGTTTAANEWLTESSIAEGVTGWAGPRIAGQLVLTNIAAATTTGTATTHTAIANAATFASLVNPITPRNLVFTLTDANDGILTLTLTILGVNQMGQTVTETLSYATGDSKTITGNVAFASLTSITMSGLTGTATATTDTLAVGLGTKIGIPFGPGLVVSKELVDGAVETVGTVNSTYGTIVLTTAPNGAHDYELFYSYRTNAPTVNQFRLTADTDVYVKYAQSGTAATAGAAVFTIEEWSEEVLAIA